MVAAFAAGMSAAALRRIAARNGWRMDPIGDGDAKTAAPGTYRRVGATCPTCVYSPTTGNGSCYAVGGKVLLAQVRAAVERGPALVAAAATMSWAANTGRVARLHVSGDMGAGSQPDAAYVDGLIAIAHEINDTRGTPRGTVRAWTYTHHTDGPWVARLREAGIAVRLSDRTGPWGAIVASFDSVPALRKDHGPIAKCPAQLRDVNCQQCRLCWERPEVAIAFDPHGFRAKLARTASPINA